MYESPTGAQFRNESGRRGMVPTLLEDLMSQRDVHKAGMREAKDDAKRSYHDQMQYAVCLLYTSDAADE